MEKLAHQNRERIPERTCSTLKRHLAAYGTVPHLLRTSPNTRRRLFSSCGTKTEAFLRFSTVLPANAAHADAERDVRGFASKSFTRRKANWDMVGNNTPVFFVRDAYKFPDFIHTQKRHPKTNLRSNAAAWDFWSLSPESLHQVTILMSDRGLPKSLRHINGYGSHTYSLINAQNERFWVKFHFKTRQGIQFMTNARGRGAVVAQDRREFAARSLGGDRAW